MLFGSFKVVYCLEFPGLSWKGNSSKAVTSYLSSSNLKGLAFD